MVFSLSDLKPYAVIDGVDFTKHNLSNYKESKLQGIIYKL